MNKKAGFSKLWILAIVVVAAAVLWIGVGDSLKQSAKLATLEVVGNIALRSIPDDVAGGFHKIPIERREIAPNVYQVTGIGNTHMVVTGEGNVLFDTGISIQVPQQMKLLREVSDAPVTHIIVSHSHADHMGGVKSWLEQAPESEIVAHREYLEEQRYLKELEPYLHYRNRVLFPWMPESPPDNFLISYGGVTPTIEVGDDDYVFEQGGVRFVVMNTAGAEGADNISLWLPQQRILFTGDTLGPLFPQFPNIFTMRGEKIRKPIEYIDTLDRLIALDIELLVPSHHDPIPGVDNVRQGLTAIRDATRYVHDEVIKGMNANKTVYELMGEIALPPELASLTQEHGKVSWAVKSIWEYYATWFHFDSTTELYNVPARDLYPDLAEMAGTEALMSGANNYFNNDELEKCLHLIEVALAGEAGYRPALELRLAVLETMLQRAIDTTGNNYEKDYLRRRIALTQEAMQGG